MIHKEGGFPVFPPTGNLQIGMVCMVLCIIVFANRARSLVEIMSFEHRISLFLYLFLYFFIVVIHSCDECKSYNDR